MASLRRRKTQAGQALIEGAMVLLPFMMLSVGTFVFAHCVWAQNQVAFVTRAASRWAAVRGSTANTVATSTSVRAYALTEAIGFDPAKLTVTTTWTPNNQPGSTVTVNVQYVVVRMSDFVMPQDLTVGSTSTVTIQQ